MDQRNPHDQAVEQAMGTLLRAGVALSAALVLGGGLVYLRQHGSEVADYCEFHGVPAELRTFDGTLRSALARHGRGWIQLGLLVLVATPVSRVVFALTAFIAERDWRYALVTLVVLGLLGFSLAHGYAG